MSFNYGQGMLGLITEAANEPRPDLDEATALSKSSAACDMPDEATRGQATSGALAPVSAQELVSMRGMRSKLVQVEPPPVTEEEHEDSV